MTITFGATIIIETFCHAQELSNNKKKENLFILFIFLAKQSDENVTRTMYETTLQRSIVM